MEATELMIGDWVYNTHHKKNIRLTPYDFFVHGHHADGGQYILGGGQLCFGRDLQPIPLTLEILRKNGWTYDGYFLLENYGVLALEVGCDGNNRFFWHLFDSPILPLNYVHELQHILKLVGSNKLIDL